FSVLDVPGLASLPKSHVYVTPAPVVPVFMKLTALPTHCGAFDVNEAIGVILILIVWVVVEEQPEVVLVTVRVIVCAPGVENLIPVGFCNIDVSGTALGPKFQL